MELHPKHHALLYSCMAKVAIDRLGETGRQAMLDGAVAYGEQRGRRMAKRAAIDGVPINAKSYLLYGEWWDKDKESDFSCTAYEPEVRLGCTVCPWCAAWQQAGHGEYGELYCSVVDAALARGFGLELEMQTSMALGSDRCRFRFPGQSISADEQQELKEQAVRLGLKAKMGWEYHDAHMYAVLRDTLQKAAGEQGLAVASAGLDYFGQLCGEEARQAVAELADTDFEALPPYEGM